MLLTRETICVVKRFLNELPIPFTCVCRFRCFATFVFPKFLSTLVLCLLSTCGFVKHKGLDTMKYCAQ